MSRLPVAERRERLLAAAFAVIARGGVGAATTRAIVDEAGMKLASFHYAFASREELLGELVEQVVHAEATALELEPTVGSTLEEILAAGLRRYFDGVRADPARERAMFELTQYAMRTEGMQPLASRQYARYRRLAAEALAEAAARSGCAWPAGTDQTAAHLVALTDGITLAWLADTAGAPTVTTTTRVAARAATTTAAEDARAATTTAAEDARAA
ncbi:TetR family transcriptional regulator C-terminal domain-containing protein, partial [Herbiconiux sp. CPCC 203406]